MKYNKMDQMEKFGEGVYRYDNHGLVVQNALEEKFHYNAKGLLVSLSLFNVGVLNSHYHSAIVLFAFSVSYSPHGKER